MTNEYSIINNSLIDSVSAIMVVAVDKGDKDKKPTTLCQFQGPMSMYAAGCFIKNLEQPREDFLPISLAANRFFVWEET